MGQREWGAYQNQIKPAQQVTLPGTHLTGGEFAANDVYQPSFDGASTYSTALSSIAKPANKALPENTKLMAGKPVPGQENLTETIQVYEETVFTKKPGKLVKKPVKSISADDRKVPGIATAGFVLSVLAVVSLFLAVVWWEMLLVGVLPGVLGLILSIAAIAKIMKQPERYKGRGYAVIGLVIGVLYCSFIAVLVESIFWHTGPE